MHGGGSVGTATAQHASKLGWALALTATLVLTKFGEIDNK